MSFGNTIVHADEFLNVRNFIAGLGVSCYLVPHA